MSTFFECINHLPRISLPQPSLSLHLPFSILLKQPLHSLSQAQVLRCHSRLRLSLKGNSRLERRHRRVRVCSDEQEISRFRRFNDSQVGLVSDRSRSDHRVMLQSVPLLHRITHILGLHCLADLLQQPCKSAPPFLVPREGEYSSEPPALQVCSREQVISCRVRGDALSCSRERFQSPTGCVQRCKRSEEGLEGR